MPRVTRSAIIDASPERVWQFVGDPLAERAWRQPELQQLELLDDGPVDVGSRYRGVTRVMGRENRYINALTEYDPPRRVAWRAEQASGPIAGGGSYELQQIGESQTRFELTLDYRPTNMLGRLLMPVIELLAGPVLQRFVLSLKRAVEATADGEHG